VDPEPRESGQSPVELLTTLAPDPAIMRSASSVTPPTSVSALTSIRLSGAPLPRPQVDSNSAAGTRGGSPLPLTVHQALHRSRVACGAPMRVK